MREKKKKKRKEKKRKEKKERKKRRRWETSVGRVGERKEGNEKSPIIFQNNLKNNNFF
jgi:hypothetical protein